MQEYIDRTAGEAGGSSFRAWELAERRLRSILLLWMAEDFRVTVEVSMLL